MGPHKNHWSHCFGGKDGEVRGRRGLGGVELMLLNVLNDRVWHQVLDGESSTHSSAHSRRAH